jgi:hypothetical protein
MYVQPLALPTVSVTSAMSPDVAAKLPPARRFALADDGRALAFEGEQLRAYTSAGRVTDLAEAPGPLAPRADSPMVVVGDSAYWIAASDTDIVGMDVPSATPSVIVRRVQAIGGLGADDKSIWYTASDGKRGRKLMRADVTAPKVTPVQLATWPSSRTSEAFVVTDTDVFVVQPTDSGVLHVVRVPKTGGHSSTLVTLPAQEEIGALAATADALYFTSGAPNQTPHDLYRVPLAGGTRSKVLSSSGGVGDVVVAEKDVIVTDRPNSAWEIESLAGGDIAQITIVASDVGRQPHLLVSPGHVAWSTANGVSFAELER